MSNHRRKWSYGDKVTLVNFTRTRNFLRGIGEDDAVFLNDYFERSMTRESWMKRIRREWMEFERICEIADVVDNAADDCAVSLGGGETLVITGIAPDRCDNCKHWSFIWHLASEDREIYRTVGECRIRSVAEDCFPERNNDELCGEHVRKESDA